MSKEIIKNKFKNGMTPNENDFGELIDFADNEASNTEVVEARGDYTVLGSRLNDSENKLKSTSKDLNREIISRKNPRPLISIIDDDGRKEFLSKWGAIIDEKDFKIDIAVITGWVGNTNFMTWEEMEDLKSTGKVNLVNHTHTHPQLATLTTEEEIEFQYSESARILQERGHHYDIMVYPGGSNDDRARRIGRKYCRAGIHISGNFNTPPLDTFKLNRASLIPSSGVMGSIKSYTDLIDEAIENNYWLIFMTHSQYDAFDATKIRAVIDYANNAGIEWASTKEGLDAFGNIIDTGDYTERTRGAEYTILDANGIMHSRTNEKQLEYNLKRGVVIDTPMSHFKINSVSVNDIDSNNSQGFPSDKPGTLITYRGMSRSFENQVYHIFDANEIYRRRWDSFSESWGDFEKISITPDELNSELVYKRLSANAFPETALIDEYENRKISVFIVNGAEPYNGKVGIVTTYRLNGNGWDRQELRVYQSNEIYGRHVASNGSWSVWEKISAV